MAAVRVLHYDPDWPPLPGASIPDLQLLTYRLRAEIQSTGQRQVRSQMVALQDEVHHAEEGLLFPANNQSASRYHDVGRLERELVVAAIRIRSKLELQTAVDPDLTEYSCRSTDYDPLICGDGKWKMN